MTREKLVKKVMPNVFANILRYAFFISLSYILIYPFLYIVLNAIKSPTDAYDVTVNWVPKSVYLKNLYYTFEILDMKNTLTRTVVYEIVAALIQFCSCAVAAYGLARFKLKGRGLIFGLIILTILVPSMMIIIPTYVNYSQMDFFGILGLISKLTGQELRPNLVGTPFVFWLPALCGVGLKGGLFTYIFMQFYKGLPKELEEAAWIDGAGAWKTFLRIVVPSSGSASITVMLFSIIWHYNDLYLAQMYMNQPTIAVALNSFKSYDVYKVLGPEFELGTTTMILFILSGCLIYILPMLIFYLLMQRKFMASIATSGIVG